MVILATVPSGGLHLLDYAMIGLYVLVTMGIVWWASRREKDTEDFFLGGRSMPWLAVGLSIMATLLSSISYLGLTGEIVKNGIAGLASQLAIFPAMLIVIPIFIPFFMRMRFTSAYEYLEHRFGYTSRLLGGILFFLLRLGWVSLVMYSGSLAMATMAGWDLKTVIIVLGVSATFYTCFGGLKAAVWTDVLQAIMLFGGAAVIVLSVWMQTGQGPSEWWAEAGRHSAGHTRPLWFSLDPTERMTIFTALLNGFFWQICTHCSDQVVLQRYASTPSLSAAVKSYITNMVAAFAIACLLGFAGLALLYFYLQHSDRLSDGLTAMSAGDKLMPYFYAHELPMGFAGLILANFLCDAMQTLVSGVNSVTAVATQDVMERLRPLTASNRERLRTARLLTLVLGGLCTVVALQVAELAREKDPPAAATQPAATAASGTPAAPETVAAPAAAPAPAPKKSTGMNIIDLMPRTFNLFLGPLACLFLIGMFLPRATERTTVPAVLVAVGVGVCWSYYRLLFHAEKDLSPMLAIFVPCCSGLLVGTVLSLLFGTGPENPRRQYTWWAVMRRPPETPKVEPELPVEVIDG